jgi:hypothetical protein
MSVACRRLVAAHRLRFKNETVTRGREAVKEVVIQPLSTLEATNSHSNKATIRAKPISQKSTNNSSSGSILGAGAR